jgi:hypothetical protein
MTLAQLGRSQGAHGRAALAQRIATLVREREVNRKALRIARARFDPPPQPAELTVNYRGPFGSIEVDVDGEELRELPRMASGAISSPGKMSALSCLAAVGWRP